MQETPDRIVEFLSILFGVVELYTGMYEGRGVCARGGAS